MRASNLIDFGVGFSQSFGDAKVALSAAMGQANVNKRRGDPKATADEGGSLSNWSVGGKVTFGAITVGGTIAESNSLGAYENPTVMVHSRLATSCCCHFYFEWRHRPFGHELRHLLRRPRPLGLQRHNVAGHKLVEGLCILGANERCWRNG